MVHSPEKDGIEHVDDVNNSVEVIELPSLTKDEELLLQIAQKKEFPDASYAWDEEGSEYYAKEVLRPDGPYFGKPAEKKLIRSQGFGDHVKLKSYEHMIELGSGTGEESVEVAKHLRPGQKAQMPVLFVDQSASNLKQARRNMDKAFPKKFPTVSGHNGDMTALRNDLRHKENKLLLLFGQTIGAMDKKTIKELFRSLLTQWGDEIAFTYFTVPKTEEDKLKTVNAYLNKESEIFVKNGLKRLLERTNRVFLSEDKNQLIDDAEYTVIYDEPTTTVKVGLIFDKNFSMAFPDRPPIAIHQGEDYWVHFSKRFFEEEMNQLIEESDLEASLTINKDEGVMLVVANNDIYMEKQTFIEQRIKSMALIAPMFLLLIALAWYGIIQDSRKREIEQKAEQDLTEILRSNGSQKSETNYERDSLSLERQQEEIKDRLFRMYDLNFSNIPQIKGWIAQALTKEENQENIRSRYGPKGGSSNNFGFIKVAQDIVKNHQTDIISQTGIHVYPYHHRSEHFDAMINTLQAEFNSDSTAYSSPNFISSRMYDQTTHRSDAIFESGQIMTKFYDNMREEYIVIAKEYQWALDPESASKYTGVQTGLAAHYQLQSYAQEKPTQEEFERGQIMSLAILAEASPSLAYAYDIFFQTYEFPGSIISQDDRMPLALRILENSEEIPLFNYDEDGIIVPKNIDKQTKAKIAEVVYFSVKNDSLDRFMWGQRERKEGQEVIKNTLKTSIDYKSLSSFEYSKYIGKYTSFKTGEEFDLYLGLEGVNNGISVSYLFAQGERDRRSYHHNPSELGNIKDAKEVIQERKELYQRKFGKNLIQGK